MSETSETHKKAEFDRIRYKSVKLVIEAEQLHIDKKTGEETMIPVIIQTDSNQLYMAKECRISNKQLARGSRNAFVGKLNFWSFTKFKKLPDGTVTSAPATLETFVKSGQSTNPNNGKTFTDKCIIINAPAVLLEAEEAEVTKAEFAGQNSNDDDPFA